ncbi:MAG: copper amine oxidase N-terminal domain-containing protein [Bacillota bacterium]
MRKLWVFLCLIIVSVTAASSAWALSRATYKGYPMASVKVDGRLVEGDVPAVIMDGRVMVPLRLVSESLGASASWDGHNGTALISSKKTLTTQKEVDDCLAGWGQKREPIVDTHNGILLNEALTAEERREKLYQLGVQYKELLYETLRTQAQGDNQLAIDAVSAFYAGEYFNCLAQCLYYDLAASGDPREGSFAEITDHTHNALTKYSETLWFSQN